MVAQVYCVWLVRKTTSWLPSRSARQGPLKQNLGVTDVSKQEGDFRGCPRRLLTCRNVGSVGTRSDYFLTSASLITLVTLACILVDWIFNRELDATYGAQDGDTDVATTVSYRGPLTGNRYNSKQPSRTKICQACKMTRG